MGGVAWQGYRETQRQLIEMTEKTAGVDQVKGATLEQISQMVEEINREYKKKSSQLQPLMQELRVSCSWGGFAYKCVWMMACRLCCVVL